MLMLFVAVYSHTSNMYFMCLYCCNCDWEFITNFEFNDAKWPQFYPFLTVKKLKIYSLTYHSHYTIIFNRSTRFSKLLLLYQQVSYRHMKSSEWGMPLTMVDMCKNADVANVSGILLQWYQLLNIRPLHLCFLQLFLSLHPHAQPQTNGRHLAGWCYLSMMYAVSQAVIRQDSV